MPNSLVQQPLVKSKKKRIRQKAMKRAMSFVQVIDVNTVPEETKTVERVTVSAKESTAFNFSKTPVTLLLKIGKKYFSEESVVKAYYNANQTEFYKNKELLIQTVESRVSQLDNSLQQEVQELISKK
ncbi:hypothetical protein U8V72_18235 [Priestia filamentosa]|uniref:hypothetical protein n=1 Tax=Priestia filamentosa TaxID=1402861 RepID=UPI0005895327